MESEIVTRVEQAPPVETEPRLTLTELRGLLREATAYERAANPAPIVLHAAPQPATMPQAGTAGADVYVPMPPQAAAYATPAPHERNPWPIVFMLAGAVGFSSGTAAIATGNEGAVAIASASIAAWSLATYRLVFCREV